MPNYVMPFPGFDLAEQELSYDYCYPKIPPEDRSSIALKAWQKGEKAARTVFERFDGNTNFFTIVKKSGLQCVREDKDYVVGERRYFSDYLSGQKRITLYTKSIALWAEENGIEKDEAANLILSHEYFHFLECTEIGLTSKDYMVPMLVIGKLKIGRTGIRALSEIGAHAFARTYYDLAEKQSTNSSQGEMS